MTAPGVHRPAFHPPGHTPTVSSTFRGPSTYQLINPSVALAPPTLGAHSVPSLSRDQWPLVLYCPEHSSIETSGSLRHPPCCGPRGLARPGRTFQRRQFTYLCYLPCRAKESKALAIPRLSRLATTPPRSPPGPRSLDVAYLAAAAGSRFTPADARAAAPRRPHAPRPRKPRCVSLLVTVARNMNRNEAAQVSALYRWATRRASHDVSIISTCHSSVRIDKWVYMIHIHVRHATRLS